MNRTRTTVALQVSERGYWRASANPAISPLMMSLELNNANIQTALRLHVTISVASEIKVMMAHILPFTALKKKP